MAKVELELKFYGKVGVGWNRGYIEVYNPHRDMWTIELKYAGGPSDYIRYGYERSQMDIVRGSWRSIGDVPGNSRVKWDTVFIEFPEEGTYRLEFYARPKSSISEEERVLVRAYTITVGGVPEVPLYIEKVSIPWYDYRDGIAGIRVYVSFSKKAPAGTTVYIRLLSNDKVVHEFTETLKAEAYTKEILVTARIPKGLQTSFKACASLDREEWKCSNEIKLGETIGSYWKIDPFDPILYEKTDETKYRIKITVLDIVKKKQETILQSSPENNYVITVLFEDRETGEKHYAYYTDSEIVRYKGETLELSPIALQTLLQAKNVIKDKYLTLSYTVPFEFNAYTEFFKNLFQDRERVDNYFRKRINYAVAEYLKANNIPFRGVSTTLLEADYDVKGIIMGYNPKVRIVAKINITVDPAVPWWLIGLIVVCAVSAIIVHEISVMIQSVETTHQEYYKTLNEYAEAWAEYEKSYYKWLSLPEEERKRTPPPEPPKLPEVEEPEKIRKKTLEETMPEIEKPLKTLETVGIIAGAIIGGLVVLEAVKTIRGK